MSSGADERQGDGQESTEHRTTAVVARLHANLERFTGTEVQLEADSGERLYPQAEEVDAD